jgi:hypothetical protein
VTQAAALARSPSAKYVAHPAIMSATAGAAPTMNPLARIETSDHSRRKPIKIAPSLSENGSADIRASFGLPFDRSIMAYEVRTGELRFKVL